MRITALGFDEFASLQQVVGKILRDLLQLSADVTSPQIKFGWMSGQLDIGVSLGHGTNVLKVHHSGTPTGLSINQWATIVLREIENHLLAGSRFSIRDVTGGGLEDKHFILPLERI